MTTSIPPKEQKSEQKVVQFLDNYFTTPVEFPVNDYDAVLSFFTRRKFQKISAMTIAQVLLTQAKIENIKVFKLIDTLSGLNSVQLSALVTKILNTSRDKTSQLGYRTFFKQQKFENNNIPELTLIPKSSAIQIQDEADSLYMKPNYVKKGYVL